MEHEIRFYLNRIKNLMNYTEDEKRRLAMSDASLDEAPMRELFKPQYVITAVKQPTGAIEIAVNNKNIGREIEYILDAYDDSMCLKTNQAIVLENIMIV